MRSAKPFCFFLLFLVACAVLPPQKDAKPGTITCQTDAGCKKYHPQAVCSQPVCECPPDKPCDCPKRCTWDLPPGGITEEKPNDFLENPSFCNVDADCTCGGIDAKTDNCFVGNKLYASKYVDFSRDCPDFCTGIAAHLETRCVSNECMNVPREGWNQPVACTEEAKLCPDGSAVGRTGPNCEFAPCPGVGCSTDNDCVPAACCHATSCVPVTNAPNCGGVACTMNCAPGTMDCGGGCECQNSQCVARLNSELGGEIIEEPGDLSNTHWLCEDGSWKETPEGCFENYCIAKGDCQLMGVKGPCGSYLIGGPTKTLHKPPVYYEDRCGAEQCSIISALCVPPEQQPRITGFDCVDTRCVVRYAQ